MTRETEKDRERLARRIDQALGRVPADLVVQGVGILDIVSGDIQSGDVAIADGWIVGVQEGFEGEAVVDGAGLIAVPGFVDTHVHIESSMVSPAEFERCVVPRGTTTAVCDPHEIANVLGGVGVEYFLEGAERARMDLRVKLSSCVPATGLETSGARLDVEDLLAHAGHPRVLGLAEFMNFPGVFAKDPGALDKLAAFQDRHIDGHCPLVGGRELGAYRAAGIRTDHESSSAEEAREKLRQGLHVLIREGSAAKDARNLAPVLTAATSPFVALCTDDRNPLDIEEEGHLDHAIRTLIAAGAPPAAVYRAASWSGARAFGLEDRGLVAPGYRADLVLLDDLESCAVRKVLLGGVPVDEDFRFAEPIEGVGRDSIRLEPIDAATLRMPGGPGEMPVIGVREGTLLTDFLRLEVPSEDGARRADPSRDLLRVCVLARHGTNRNVGRGFVKGFGLRGGAIASSVGHDSHNVIVVGADEADMVAAVNRLIELEGGITVAARGAVTAELPLPLAGLMSDRPVDEVCGGLRGLREAVGELGCPLKEPFLQLAFLPLPVIPHLKITDMGLVDVDRFELIPTG